MALKTKKTILIMIEWYIPGYKAGGPIKSIHSIINYLKGTFNFLIITSDTDFGEKLPYNEITSDIWLKMDDAVSVLYLSKSNINSKKIYHLLRTTDYDLLYLNSLFSVYFSLFPLLFHRLGVIKKQLILAPRGMLGAGALKLKSRKKKIFLTLSKQLTLYKHIHWHATSEGEKSEILKNIGRETKITVVPNLQYKNVKEIQKKPKKDPGVLKLFFLSRISEKKNLLYALTRLTNITINLEEQLIFDIYGPIEDELYWNKCLKLIDKLNKKGYKVNHLGSIKSEDVANMMSNYHFLLLPTLNENYGHVIVESFFSGTPVITSDQTPWRDLESYNVGWDIALNEAVKFENCIKICLEMTDDLYKSMVNASIHYATRFCNSEKHAILMEKLFQNN